MKEIKLTQGYVALIDDEDYFSISQFNWHAEVVFRKDGSIRQVYAKRRISKTTQRMHRLLLGATDPRIDVDHKDNSGLNNQRHNLRVSTRQQNLRNRGTQRNGTSGFKGVSWHKGDKAWYANITFDGKLQNLGRFLGPLEAACAYDMAAIKYFGEFAHCNFAIPN
jgi:hypothetical protein